MTKAEIEKAKAAKARYNREWYHAHKEQRERANLEYWLRRAQREEAERAEAVQESTEE